ncbi:MAG TPA: 3'(2'),5'-bisphosphate nucleotidase CysQ [Longimicrobiales bacterium]
MPADLALAIEAARAAGDVVMKSFRTDQHVSYKSPDQPLTAADLAADALIKSVLLDNRPAYGWLSEETADTAARLERTHVWVVDPIDGTRSFVAGRAEFAISIGLAVEGVAVLGVVYNPATDELFTAVGGGGARAGDRRLRITAERRRSVIAASRSEIGRGDFESFVEDYDLLPTGSTAYKLARVAAGEADIFLSRGPKAEWDLCAGALIVAEAGGMVTDLAGHALQYNRPDPHITGVLAARAGLHAEMLRRIRGTGK